MKSHLRINVPVKSQLPVWKFRQSDVREVEGLLTACSSVTAPEIITG